MRLTIEQEFYVFTPTSAIATKIIVKRKESLNEIKIVGKIIIGFHDFADLCNPNEKFREIMSFG